jgi:uncharacterized protein
MAKKILLLSDTHGYIDEKILAYCKLADEVWHAGDIGSLEVTDEIAKWKPVRAVYGNIDDHEVRRVWKLDEIFTVDKVKVWITHIGGYPKKYNLRIKEALGQIKPGLFICGHSHILKVQFDQEHNMLHMNPGAAGIQGFHQIRTMLRFEIDGENIKNLEIIEMQKVL